MDDGDFVECDLPPEGRRCAVHGAYTVSDFTRARLGGLLVAVALTILVEGGLRLLDWMAQ